MYPIIRGRKSPPKLGHGKDTFVLPAQKDVKAQISSISVITAKPTVTSSSNRVTIWEDDFASGYGSRWQNVEFSYLNGNVTRTYETLNGYGAVRLSWPAGSTPAQADSHGVAVNPIPGGPYTECWFHQEMKFGPSYAVGPSSGVRGTQKLFRLNPVAGATGACIGNDCPTNTWSFRLSTRQGNGVGVPYDPTRVPVERYINYGDQPTTCSEDLLFNDYLPLDTLLHFELHWKLNSASGVSDGICEVRVNDQLITGGGPGEIIGTYHTKDNDDFVWYCGGESYRANARFNSFLHQQFYGGGGSGWEPAIKSELVFGHIWVEVPS